MIHSAIKIKSVDIELIRHIEFIKEIYYQDPKFKIDGIVKISKYKNIFAKGYLPNWSE